MKIIYDDPQRGYGSQRVAELLAIAKVAKKIGAAAYVSMGYGAGFDFQVMGEKYAHIPAIGFDKRDPMPYNIYPGVVCYNETIFVPDPSFTAYAHGQKFTDSVEEKISILMGLCDGPILYYTDNGNKKCELKGLLPRLRPGDAIGTHDWGDSPTGRTVMGNTAEVHEKDCGFLYDAGLQEASFIKAWLSEHRCMQKFWIKP